MLFRHKILKAPTTFDHNQSHKVPEFLDFFINIFDFTVYRGIMELEL